MVQHDGTHRGMVAAVLEKYPNVTVDESRRERMNKFFEAKGLVCPCNGRFACPCHKLLSVHSGEDTMCGCKYFIKKAEEVENV